MTEKISVKEKKPLYLQLSELISNKILSGDYKYGEKIPSEQELGIEYELSRVTVRKALQDLVDKGIVEKKQGKGVYVKFPVYKETFNAGGSFTSSGKTLNNVPTSEIIGRGKIKIENNSELSQNFEADEAIQLIRVRYINGTPVIYEVDLFDLELSAVVENVGSNSSLIDTLKEKGYEINHFDNVLDIFFSNEQVSEKLNIPVNTPLLRIKQQVLDSYGKLIYFNEQYINSDYYKAAIRSY